MKAVVIREHGDLDVLRLEDLPEPEPGPGEVQIAVRAIGLNHLDTWVRRGVPGHTFPLPIVPGCDMSGVVTKLGAGVRQVAVGERVLVAPGLSCGRCRHCAAGEDPLCRDYGILGETCDGGCRELAVVPAQNALPIPDGIDFVQAAAFPLTFLTAWHMLVARCGIQPGDDVLVHAAGSGVGSAAVQIAKLFGARVLATAGSREKLEKARALGADVLIDYETTSFKQAVREATGKRGVDIVVEHVGERTIGDSIQCLAKGGRVVTCGATTGPRLETNLQLVFFKGLSILGSTMGSRAELIRIVGLVARGLLRPIVDRVLPLEEVAQAHRALGEREAFGKIVLVTGAPDAPPSDPRRTAR